MVTSFENEPFFGAWSLRFAYASTEHLQNLAESQQLFDVGSYCVDYPLQFSSTAFLIIYGFPHPFSSTFLPLCSVVSHLFSSSVSLNRVSFSLEPSIFHPSLISSDLKPPCMVATRLSRVLGEVDVLDGSFSSSHGYHPMWILNAGYQ